MSLTMMLIMMSLTMMSLTMMSRRRPQISKLIQPKNSQKFTKYLYSQVKTIDI